MSNKDYDAIVIGGGPAGATAATLVAMQGHRVLLLERDHFPRHRVGESLLPATIHGICGLLGMLDDVENANFLRKRGGTFLWGKSGDPWTFKFARNTDAPGGYAYQVERSRFDKMLLDNARAKGVIVKEGRQVKEILRDGDRVCGVDYADEDGGRHRATAHFVVDGGGSRARQYNREVGERIYSKFFQNIAIYTYFNGGKRLPAPNAGNALSVAFADGWLWYIPLTDTLTSVGAVVSKEVATEALRKGHAKAFESFIADCPTIAEYLQSADRIVNGEYGKFRVCEDYSYCNSKFWDPGIALIGDSACFVDPVFSSGVHLATFGGLLAARSVNTCLAEGMHLEEKCFNEFEMRYRREYGNFYQFCSAFYDMDQTTDSYFWAARKVLNTQERGNEAFIKLIAGVASGSEPVFNSEEYFQARIGLGVWFQDMMSKNPLGENVAPVETPVEFDRSKFHPEKFMQGFTAEITNLQMLAVLGDSRPAERGLGAGMIPSRDGFRWMEKTAA